MSNISKEDLEVMNMVNNKGNDSLEKVINRAKSNSINKERRNYKKKKMIPIKSVAMAIVAASLISSTLGVTLTNYKVNNENVVIPINSEITEDVDIKIQYYQGIMGMNGDENTRIETAYGRNENNLNDPNVDYSYTHLVNNIVKASKESEEEVRCVIIAAYNIINSPYRDEVFGKTFDTISKLEDINFDNMKFLKDGSVEKFLEYLGYNNWKEYQMNERKNIKDLSVINNYVNNSGIRR